MRTNRWIAAAAALLIAASATTALAASREITVRDGTLVNGRTLSDGEYTFKWTGTGDNVKVSVVRGMQNYGVIPAALETRPEAMTSDAVIYEKAGDNTWKIKEIRFAGKKEVLVLKG